MLCRNDLGIDCGSVDHNDALDGSEGAELKLA